MGRHSAICRTRRRWRVGLPFAATVLVAAAVALSTQPAGAAANPVQPSGTSGHGFGVLVEHDATLLSNESETGVAIGGTLSFGDYQVIDKDSSPYTVAGDSAPTALVAGAIDWDASSGHLQVNQSMGAKIGGSYDINNTNANAPRLVRTGSGFDATPQLQLTTPQTANSSTGASGFDLPTLFTTYRGTSDGLAALADTGVLRNDAGTAPWTSGNARLVLAPGQNVLTVTPAQLAALGSVNPGGGATLGAGTWLIINVIGSGDFALSGPTAAIAYAGGSAPQSHVLWNLTTTGTVTLAGSDQVEGTIFAPRARLVDDNGKNIEGDVVVSALHQSGGEIHGFHFGHTPDFPPTGPSASTETTTVTAPPSTETTTVTAPPSTETVTAPGSTETTMVSAPATTVTATTSPDDSPQSTSRTPTDSASSMAAHPTRRAVAGVSASRAAGTQPQLANTGASVVLLFLLAAALLIGGITLLLLAGRRERPRKQH